MRIKELRNKEPDRRQFLKKGAILAGLAAGGLGIRSAMGQDQTRAEQLAKPPANPTLLDTGSMPGGPTIAGYGTPSPFEASVSRRPNTPQQDLDGVITPSGLHFVVWHGPSGPQLDPKEYRLEIQGLVDRPLIFTLDELKRLPSVSRVHFVQCAGNSYLFLQNRLNAKTCNETHGRISTSEWTGVPLSLVLKEAGVKQSGTWLTAEGSDVNKHTASIPTAKGMDDVLLAYSQNGEAVRPENGYPVRFLIPGVEGMRNVKAVKRIVVTDTPAMAKWESTVYNNLRMDGKARWYEFEFEPNSVITRPSGGQHLPGRGFYEITGIAWSGHGSVHRVEVSTDSGKTWKDAEIQQPIPRKAGTRFRMPWTWDGNETHIMSRCTDEFGEVQPNLVELSKIWNVNTDFWTKSSVMVEHFTAIQPWRVAKDGSISNAIWDFV